MLSFDQFSQIVVATNTMPAKFMPNVGRFVPRNGVIALLSQYKKQSFGDGLEPQEFARLKASIESMDCLAFQHKLGAFVPQYNVHYILSGYTCMDPDENDHYVNFMNSEWRKIEEQSRPPREEPIVLKKPTFFQKVRWVLNW
jgi:hypothetical protein